MLLFCRWRERYESLYESVEPFKDELEKFQLEKEQLLGRSKNAQSDLEKLSKDYAKLLGHCNQKQKIKHVMKLKEENNDLKLVGIAQNPLVFHLFKSFNCKNWM